MGPNAWGLDKNTGNAHFRSQRMHHNVGFCIKMYTKFRGRDPRTSAAEGETFVRTHPRAHLPDAGAHAIILGWLRPCTEAKFCTEIKLYERKIDRGDHASPHGQKSLCDTNADARCVYGS